MSADPPRSIAFLASYPRSGNTFLRGLLANYHSGLDRPLCVQEIAQFGAGEKSEALWFACTHICADTRTLEQEWRARADYLSLIRALPGQGPVMFKTHCYNAIAYGVAAFDVRPSDRIVYIVRHPFDVVLSAAAFYGLDVEAMAARLVLAGAFNDEGGVGPFEPTGSWLENVAGWLNETRCPILLVRYRDLLAEPAGQLGRVLGFLGHEAPRTRLAAAAAHSSFETMAASHRQNGFDQGPRRDRRALFFRQGRMDQWKSDLPRPLQKTLDEQVGPLMDVLGFERPEIAP